MARAHDEIEHSTAERYVDAACHIQSAHLMAEIQYQSGNNNGK